MKAYLKLASELLKVSYGLIIGLLLIVATAVYCYWPDSPIVKPGPRTQQMLGCMGFMLRGQAVAYFNRAVQIAPVAAKMEALESKDPVRIKKSEAFLSNAKNVRALQTAMAMAADRLTDAQLMSFLGRGSGKAYESAVDQALALIDRGGFYRKAAGFDGPLPVPRVSEMRQADSSLASSSWNLIIGNW